MEYKKLVEVYEQLEKTSKRLEKTYIISELLKGISSGDIQMITLLIQGRLFPRWDERKLGVASQLVLKALHKATGIAAKEIENEWKKTGDLGLVAENLTREKKQDTLVSLHLTVRKVFENLRKLPELEGKGAVEKKISLISELLSSAKPKEAKYIVRTVLEELRIGVGEGSLRDAIVWAFFGEEVGISYHEGENDIEVSDRETYNRYVDDVQKAYDVTNDFAVVAQKAKEKGLKAIQETSLVVGKPIKVMLALKVDDVKEGFERCGKPADFEYKLDGFRIQGHKHNGNITLFTRRLENVTKQFPDVVGYIRNGVKGNTFIIDSEAVGYNPRTGKYLPFQKISQRIKRKYEIERMVKEFPVEVNVFDVISYNGKSMLNQPFIERRKLLENMVKQEKRKIVVVKNIVTDSEKEAEKFYKESINAGNEGVMIKKLDGIYQPGARVGHMCKMKPVMETLDLVIVGAEWGEGKRAKWLSSYTVACIDDNGKFQEVGKVSTGLKEKKEEGISFEQLTKELKPLITGGEGKEVTVRPRIVVEVDYGEIQKSPTYSSGYALRFPRIVGLRLDRSPEECSTFKMVVDFFKGQKKR